MVGQRKRSERWNETEEVPGSGMHAQVTYGRREITQAEEDRHRRRKTANQVKESRWSKSDMKRAETREVL